MRAKALAYAEQSIKGNRGVRPRMAIKHGPSARIQGVLLQLDASAVPTLTAQTRQLPRRLYRVWIKGEHSVADHLPAKCCVDEAA